MKIHICIHPVRSMAFVVLTIVFPIAFLLSCNRNKQEMVEVVFDPQTSYTSKQVNVEQFVSDSGVTRYKMTASTILNFQKASEPYWYFPDGVYVEKFDTLFNIEVSIKADEAYHYERRKLWEANGNVDMTNAEGVRFQTSQIFWDDQNKTIYSDSLIRITKEGMINIGTKGFRSNQDLSVYEIFDSRAEITVDSQRRAIPADSISPRTDEFEIRQD